MWLFVIGAIVMAAVLLLLFLPVTLALYTLLLAALTQLWRDKNHGYQTAVYVGRVSHTRLVPVVHSFSYPLFMCAVDLEEVETLWGTTTTTTTSGAAAAALWPLSTIIQFRATDHYKNGEGGNEGSLIERTFSLIKERTNNKQQFSLQTHRIVLLTHLCYYGYCFNPVSFYYILKRKDNKVDAIVTEVSNTPWNEMHVYVLHPSSMDVVEQQCVCVKQSSQETTTTTITNQVLFEKTFHVSPFMAMDYMYDWVFSEFSSNGDHPMFIHASMKKANTNAVEFTATVQLHRQPLSSVAWQVVKFPMYCAIIQVWIHIEALRLFIKGVAFQPHPNGSETTASRIIGNIMTPLFAIKHWLTNKKQD